MARSNSPKSSARSTALPFEKPIEEVRHRLAELEALSEQTSYDLSEEIEFYRDRLQRLTEEIYSELGAWERVQVARHPERPLTSDYLEHMCEEFIELRGDGFYGDDPAVVTGFGKIGEHRVMLVGHRKGKTTKARLNCNFGSAHPEGYRKALRKMRLAERLQLPIVALVNTPGAYPGVGAEERGQARAIAENIYAMVGMRVPILVIVIGEGGSGGALGIAVGDRIGMLENAWYSVISPEGCASILWKSADGKERAASALKLTAGDLKSFGIVDQILPEPAGGAHSDPQATIQNVREQLVRWLDELQGTPIDKLLAERYQKFRRIAKTRGGVRSVAEPEAAELPADTGSGDEAELETPRGVSDKEIEALLEGAEERGATGGRSSRSRSSSASNGGRNRGNGRKPGPKR